MAQIQGYASSDAPRSNFACCPPCRPEPHRAIIAILPEPINRAESPLVFYVYDKDIRRGDIMIIILVCAVIILGVLLLGLWSTVNQLSSGVRNLRREVMAHSQALADLESNAGPAAQPAPTAKQSSESAIRPRTMAQPASQAVGATHPAPAGRAAPSDCGRRRAGRPGRSLPDGRVDGR